MPERLAERITAIPENKRNDWLTEVLEDALNDEETPAPTLTEAEIKDLGEAFADMDAGRVTSGEMFSAEIRSDLGLPPRPFWSQETGSVKQ